MPDADAEHWQVLVVGAGPAGLVAGITLARYGVRVLIVDKRDGGSTLSRALVVSTRSMELLRAWGLEEAVRAGAADVEPCGWLTPTLASGEGTVFPLGYPATAETAAVSPTRPACAPQDHLEPILLAHLQSFPHAAVRFGCELLGLEQDRAGVRALVRDKRSDRPKTVGARYVVGADGAHSAVRQILGIRMEGRDALGDFHRVEFRAPLASLVGDRRYLLNVVTHPDAAGGVLTPPGRGDRWGFTREVRAGQVGPVDYSEDRIVALLATASGVAALRPRLERRSRFVFAAQIAERYRDRRVFLVGDAAHRTTPRGGTGMNTAIHDAYDLGWKLGWVLRGWAAADLLDSYERERRPVGAHNVGRSADPDGARQTAADALPWDLNGRLAHQWVRRGDTAVSTLDLLGDGLTVLAGPEEPGWAEAVAALDLVAPVATHAVDEAVARGLGIPPGGALLVRPDGRPVLQWTTLDRPDLGAVCPANSAGAGPGRARSHDVAARPCVRSRRRAARRKSNDGPRSLVDHDPVSPDCG
jgi:2-polyprenyl-6-methoxyphenol hydroxylase-like FAD-dependent oxidoreductase